MKVWPVTLTLGIIGLITYLLFFMMAIAFSAGRYNEGGISYNIYGEMLIFICTPTILLPSIILTYYGHRGRLKYKELTNVANYLKTYRTIKLTELASKLDKPELETKEIIKKCLKEKLVSGYLDPIENVFKTNEYFNHLPESKKGWKCTACGGFNDSIILPGETAKCNYCGKLQTSTTKSGSPAQPSLPGPVAPPPPHPPPPHPPPTATTCRWCSAPLVYVSQYGKWFCNRCQRYH